MARMIEALKQAQPTHTASTPEPVRPELKLAEEPEHEESMPFIEVGSRYGPVDGSPDVLAVPLPVRMQTAVAPAAPAAPVAPAMSVAFQPWPAQRSYYASRTMAPELVAYHQPEHAVSQQYKGLLQHLLGQGDTQRVLFFTAAAAQVGATTTLLNLAIAACADKKRRVAVLDLNMQRPAIASRLGLLMSPGLQDVLAGSVALEQAVQATALADLYALPVMGPSAARAGFLTAEALRWVICWLRERFDVIFVDGPPWEENHEMVALATACDAIYPVLPETEAHKPLTLLMLQSIARRGGRLRGLIHTQRAA